MQDRFDFEQTLMRCWGVVDDIQDVILKLSESEYFEGKDYVENMLMGLYHLYDVKFNSAFDLFEELVREKKL